MARDTTAHVAPLGFKVWRMERHNKTATMPAPHAHADIEVNYLSSGWIRYFHGQRFYEVHAGQFALFWAGIPHQLQAHSPVLKGVWITFPVTWLLRWQLPGRLQDALMSGELVYEPRAEGYEARSDELHLENWLAEYLAGGDERLEIVRLELEARIRRLAAPFATAARRSPLQPDGSLQQFVRMTTFLSENHQRPIAVEDVAEALSLHPKYCLALFKKCCGMTLWNYLLRLRIAHAQRLLLTVDANILQVALDSGFGTSSAFYQAFKKHTGMTPAKFRKEHLKEK